MNAKMLPNSSATWYKQHVKILVWKKNYTQFLNQHIEWFNKRILWHEDWSNGFENSDAVIYYLVKFGVGWFY